MEENLLIPIEHAVEGTEKYGLGRRPALDPRDNLHALPKRAVSVVMPTFKYYATATALNQWEEPHCVGFSWEQYLLSAPVKNKMWQTPADLYRQAQLVDEWEGTDYEGTSVRAGAKVLHQLGYLSEYQWAFDAETAIQHVLTKSPVVMGTNWYWDMFEPDSEGFIHVGGALSGGHAYMVKGANRKKKCPDGSMGAFRIINSWGTNWGEKGMAWISFNDMDRLIKEWGEACTATELKFKVEAQG